MKILVAGVGNIFLGDDAFGVEVVQRLFRQEIPEQARLLDAGIRGVHLAYELLDGYDALILVDAVTHGEAPGTVSIFERRWEGGDIDRDAGSVADAHDLDPESVLSLLASLGGRVERVFTVGCEPAQLGEQMGLSAPVAAAVEPAAQAVHKLIDRLLTSQAERSSAPPAEVRTQEIPR